MNQLAFVDVTITLLRRVWFIFGLFWILFDFFKFQILINAKKKKIYQTRYRNA